MLRLNQAKMRRGVTGRENSCLSSALSDLAPICAPYLHAITIFLQSLLGFMGYPKVNLPLL